MIHFIYLTSITGNPILYNVNSIHCVCKTKSEHAYIRTDDCPEGFEVMDSYEEINEGILREIIAEQALLAGQK